MDITGKVHCFFEQSGTFKNEFIKLGIPAEDYDIQNNFGETYLQRNFIAPTIIDKNRTLRGDVFVKPTAYWFVNCEATQGFSYQRDKEVKIVYKAHDKVNVKTGECSEARSMIHPDYARNFICDFILGKKQQLAQQTLF